MVTDVLYGVDDAKNIVKLNVSLDLKDVTRELREKGKSRFMN